MSGIDLSLLMVASTPLEAARVAVDMGLVPVPIIRGKDRKPAARWGTDDYNPPAQTLPSLFSSQRNIALIGGARSGGLVDIDIDSPLAAPFVELLFPGCPTFGRPSRPRTHIQITCPNAKTRKLAAPQQAAEETLWASDHGTCIVEVQSDKKLITIPPSIHPSGEPYRWDGIATCAPSMSVDELNLAVGTMAFMAVFNAYYPPSGGRNAACVAATGALVRAGHSGEKANALVQLAAQLNQDRDWKNRGSGEAAEGRMERGDPVQGITALQIELGLKTHWKAVLRDWLHPSDPDQLVLDKNAPLDTARLFLAGHQLPEGRTFCLDQNRYFSFENGGWRKVDEIEVTGMLYSFMERAVTKTKDGSRPFKPQPSSVQAAIHALKPLITTPDGGTPKWLDGRLDPPADQIIAFENGLVDARTLALSPATPQLFTQSQIPRSFDPHAPRPDRFLAWLESLWPDQQTTIDMVQEIVGLCLTSDTSFQKVFMLFGPPRAGKGVLTSIIQALMGPKNYSSPTLASLGEGFGTQSSIGKLLAFIPDARLDMSAQRNGVTQTLLAISGEDSQAVRRKFKEDWEGKLTIRFIITTNEIPQLRDDAGALTARLVPVVFSRSFAGQEDRFLKTKLATELPGITLWALQGYLRLKDRGYFVLPPESDDLLARMKAVFSQLGSFIGDCLIDDDDAATPFSVLFATYQEWAHGQGMRKSMTASQFGERLNELGYPTVQRRPDKVRARAGLRLNDEWAKKMNLI